MSGYFIENSILNAQKIARKFFQIFFLSEVIGP